jgi:hypothetical protein
VQKFRASALQPEDGCDTWRGQEGTWDEIRVTLTLASIRRQQSPNDSKAGFMSRYAAEPSVEFGGVWKVAGTWTWIMLFFTA